MAGQSRTLPVPRAAAGPLRRLADGAVRQLGVPTPAGALADAADAAGLRPLGVGLRSGPAGRAAVVLVEPGPPELRADFLGPGLRRMRGALPGGVLVLSPAEYALWRASLAREEPIPASWGELPPPPRSPELARRRRGLRRASGLLLDELPRRAAASRRGERGLLATAGERLRDEAESVGPASRFPPIPPLDSSLRVLMASSIGVAHAAFAGLGLEEDGPPVPVTEAPSAPPRSMAAVRRLLDPLLADLPDLSAAEAAALYLVPGPWGRRHAYRLVAVVPDDAPLHRAAGLWDRLHAHLGLVASRALRAAFLPQPAPVVLTRATLRSMLRGRLFPSPLERLSWRFHRVLLRGEDVAAEGFVGLDFSDEDLGAELAAGFEATARVFAPGALAAEADDLLFGTWPALLDLLHTRTPLNPLSAVHAALARRTDPALARVGSEATRAAWGDPQAVDLGRASPRLRDRGPALVRLQEVAVENLG